jgi:hypothetical protein
MYVTVMVVENYSVVFPWTMFSASVDQAFTKLFEEVQPQVDTDCTSVKCFLSTIKGLLTFTKSCY